MSILHSQHRLDIQTPEGTRSMAYMQWHNSLHEQQPLLLCVHGLTRNSRDFDFLAEKLAEHYRVICPDVLGRGDSDWLQQPALYGYPLYIAQMQQLLAHLFSEFAVSRCDWVGTSMGGLIGMMLAAAPGDTIGKLVLNDVGPFISYSALARLGQYVGKAPHFAHVGEAEQYLRQVAQPFGPLTDEQWAHLALHGTESCDDGLCLRYDPAIADGFAAVTGDVDLSAVWSAVHCPVLVIRGAESDLLLAETARSMLQHNDTQLVEFPGIGHAPMLMARDQITAVQNFLTR
ncbi:alpha/beta hydrolase [Thalassolituus sp. ST750PaO-4]|uniref:alpha/beta fold hydrolase n=1 Tax=Thalassolituus sp. ST750PaO-4 TaxID=2742965 RepID=UPI000C3F6A44|nr:alpha/beta hydrolase [Thalassolituus sp. ST750PaO-4]MCA6060508.1 alpha/beta hydrolase [Thalassolituus sp. ST750PaO-4]PIQ38850.1 MAG: alpha/beta hydrolase [Thalassolituus sp. CG17_big_fil_post_rev_8_21_14_2_50_53_8]